MIYYAEYIHRNDAWVWVGSGGTYDLENLWYKAARGLATVIRAGDWSPEDRALGRDLYEAPRRVVIR